jgi:phosphatidylserine/phosphatidylglycerophosphate/cardiolipin synthase-like enzyme
VRRARRLIYIEDQYLWSAEVARLFAQALRDNPELHLVAVLPRHPDLPGNAMLSPNVAGRLTAMQVCQRASPDRVHCFDVESPDGVPVYVHAKVCVVDDVWASVGSNNINRRSWTLDTELCCAVLDATGDAREPADPAGLGDGARAFARDLRLRLWREHLGRDQAPADLAAAGDRAALDQAAVDQADDADLLDPESAVRAMVKSAEELDAWHAGGRAGPRPPGRLRQHQPERLSLATRLWAVPVYRLVFDPDGRPWRLRRRRTW